MDSSPFMNKDDKVMDDLFLAVKSNDSVFMFRGACGRGKAEAIASKFALHENDTFSRVLQHLFLCIP